MRSLEFHVVAAGAGANNVVEEKEAEVVSAVVVDANIDADSNADAKKNKEEEIEELGVKSQSMLLQERQDRAKKSRQVVSLLDTPNKTTATVAVDEENTEVGILLLFEEIRSAIGFSPLNNTNNLIPHDEDLMGWHSPEAPRPNRCLI